MGQTKILVCLVFMFICMNIKMNSACMTGPTPNVSITRLINDKGALCLDGTPPAYYLDQGEGDGINNWVIYLEGGGWCSTVEECVYRSKQNLGSSKYLKESLQFANILSKDSKTNPDFYSWNRVYIHYCDGSSYTGDVDTVNPATNITYRGGRIFNVVMEDLLKRGMKNATNAILSGSSAGGLAVVLHCDRFQSLLPTGAKVKCFSDSAYFIHEDHLRGEKQFDIVFERLITLHGSGQMLPSFCTDIFIKPSLVKYNLSPKHHVCLVYQNCTLVEANEIEALRLEFLDALSRGNPSSMGIWVTSCIGHDLIEGGWIPPKSNTINGNKAHPEAFGDWFYDRCAINIIDISNTSKNCTDSGIHMLPII
ncbi:PREDICTED: pectin acetylesterase 8-like [Ipomoea nil]|uniref:pectin acetylesterase 8-like n=1 Tax=Ipomoea nil TaxID=35883 RepID=UPI0009011BE0|nr:PREDICTED: pectin acetylesterase 8-like [Ipomoea nil]